MPHGGEMRVQKTRYEPVDIALENLDQPVIRIEQAPFLAGERLGWRKFVSSLYGEIFLEEDDVGSGRRHSRLRPDESYFVLNYSRRQWIHSAPRCCGGTNRLGEQLKSFRLPRAANSLIA